MKLKPGLGAFYATRSNNSIQQPVPTTILGKHQIQLWTKQTQV